MKPDWIFPWCLLSAKLLELRLLTSEKAPHVLSLHTFWDGLFWVDSPCSVDAQQTFQIKLSLAYPWRKILKYSLNVFRGCRTTSCFFLLKSAAWHPLLGISLHIHFSICRHKELIMSCCYYSVGGGREGQWEREHEWRKWVWQSYFVASISSLKWCFLPQPSQQLTL